MIKKILRALALILPIAVFAGCATQGVPVSILYAPSAGGSGGGGELFLKTATDPAAEGAKGYLRWVIGKREDAYGTVIGDVLSANSAQDTVLDALKSELTAAGYRVVLTAKLPIGVSKGVELDAAQFEVREKVKFPKIEAVGKIRLTLAIWKNGALVRKMNYRTENSDFALLHGDRLPRDLVEQGLEDVMRQAVPDIVKVLEEKPVMN